VGNGWGRKGLENMGLDGALDGPGSRPENGEGPDGIERPPPSGPLTAEAMASLLKKYVPVWREWNSPSEVPLRLLVVCALADLIRLDASVPRVGFASLLRINTMGGW